MLPVRRLITKHYAKASKAYFNGEIIVSQYYGNKAALMRRSVVVENKQMRQIVSINILMRNLLTCYPTIY